jgi:hypothetical protein
MLLLKARILKTICDSVTLCGCKKIIRKPLPFFTGMKVKDYDVTTTRKMKRMVVREKPEVKRRRE